MMLTKARLMGIQYFLSKIPEFGCELVSLLLLRSRVVERLADNFLAKFLHPFSKEVLIWLFCNLWERR